MRRTCTIEGCAKFVAGHGLCGMHYMRSRRHGSTDRVDVPGVDPVHLDQKECGRCRVMTPASGFHPAYVTGKRGVKKILQSYCKPCRAAAKREYQVRLRRDVLNAYGGACACCGESEESFLSIDHINGGGAKHRASIGSGGTALYAWLRNRDYPKDSFQVLCMNCNFAKGSSGQCPHEKRRVALCLMK